MRAQSVVACLAWSSNDDSSDADSRAARVVGRARIGAIGKQAADFGPVAGLRRVDEVLRIWTPLCLLRLCQQTQHGGLFVAAAGCESHRNRRCAKAHTSS